MDAKLEKIIKKIEQLPTLPVISQKILELLSDEKVSYKEIVKIVENDQSLTLKILKTANSAFYGSISNISSLEHAMVKLGMNEVRSIVLGVSVHNFFSSPNNTSFDRGRFWKHSIVCSQVAKYLGTFYNIRNDDSLFLSGLIHDMGKVVLDEYFHDEFLRIIEYIESNNTAFSKAEKALTGTTHYQIAAKLLSQWKFPKNVIMMVLYHHAPWATKSFEDSSIILYLANIITKLAGFSSHPAEEAIDILEFSKSSNAEFIIENGYDLSYDTLVQIVNHVKEFVAEEADSMMRFFD